MKSSNIKDVIFVIFITEEKTQLSFIEKSLISRLKISLCTQFTIVTLYKQSQNHNIG